MLNELMNIAACRGDIKYLWKDRHKSWVRLNIKHNIKLIRTHRQNIQIFKRMTLEYLNHKKIPYIAHGNKIIFGKIVSENNRYYIVDMNGKHVIAKNWIENLELLKRLHEYI